MAISCSWRKKKKSAKRLVSFVTTGVVVVTPARTPVTKRSCTLSAGPRTPQGRPKHASMKQVLRPQCRKFRTILSSFPPAGARAENRSKRRSASRVQLAANSNQRGDRRKKYLSFLLWQRAGLEPSQSRAPRVRQLFGTWVAHADGGCSAAQFSPVQSSAETYHPNPVSVKSIAIGRKVSDILNLRTACVWIDHWDERACKFTPAERGWAEYG